MSDQLVGKNIYQQFKNIKMLPGLGKFLFFINNGDKIL